MSLAVIIPTYNEEDLLRRCIDTLGEQGVELVSLVVNAGRPLPEDLASRVTEIEVPSDYFWTACIDEGLKVAEGGGYEYIMFANSDTEFMPNSVRPLLEAVQRDPKLIACCPAYIPDGQGGLTTLYSSQGMTWFLMHNWNRREWSRPEDAPEGMVPSDVIGGQGTLFHRDLLKHATMDAERFPQVKGDSDFWIQAKRAGYRLMVLPQTGVINNRGFGDTGGLTRKQRFKKAWYLMSSPRARDSWPTLWRYRMKHMPLPVALASFLVSVPVIWGWRFAKFLRYR